VVPKNAGFVGTLMSGFVLKLGNVDLDRHDGDYAILPVVAATGPMLQPQQTSSFSQLGVL
jgi:hypothetical protein